MYENWKKGAFIYGNLPPLVTIPGYRYTEEQRQHLLEMKHVNVPEIGHFEIGNAVLNEVKSNESPNILLSTRIDDEALFPFLKTIFTKYTSNPSTKARVEFKDQIIMDTYPIIIRTSTGTAFVVFDPQTQDAKKAILMTKKLELWNQKTNIPIKLYFFTCPLPRPQIL